MTDKNTFKLMESISDDLFKIKLELGLIRIDDLSDYYETDPNDDSDAAKLKTHFQRMFYCRRKLRRCVFWANTI